MFTSQHVNNVDNLNVSDPRRYVEDELVIGIQCSTVDFNRCCPKYARHGNLDIRRRYVIHPKSNKQSFLESSSGSH